MLVVSEISERGRNDE